MSDQRLEVARLLRAGAAGLAGLLEIDHARERFPERLRETMLDDINAALSMAKAIEGSINGDH